MKRILKYYIPLLGSNVIYMPEGAEIISAIYQDGNVVVYAIVDDARLEKNRIIEVFGTGRPIMIHAELKFISTIQMGELVWHLFERIQL